MQQIIPSSRHNIFDPKKFLMGLVRKGKKGKTKCQQKRRRSSRPSRYEFAVPFGHTIRQCSRKKFIMTYQAKAELVDLKRKTISTIEPDSKIGKRFAK